MGVKIMIHGADIESDEYQAALKLKKIIIDSLKPNVEGEIVLFASATLMGQAVKDVDLFMIGQLNNYVINAEFSDGENGFVRKNVEISSFCTTIEIKRHDISGIILNGTDFYVRYGRSKHCVTLQSNNQKISAMNFFKRTITYSPFITNVIWFTQATKRSVENLCITENGERMISNVIGDTFDFSELMQLLVYQRKPYFYNGRYIFDSNSECSVNDIQKALTLFSKSKESVGELTRRRIEQITCKAFENTTLIDTQGKVSIYRGRAGTGKTVGLIQTAIKLVDENQARVLILTYNKALVSDIRRLFALAELPDMFESKCVHINTLHSYFYKLANTVLYDGRISGDKFINKYRVILKELSDFLDDSENVELVKELCYEDSALDWDYVLIDEAQDWSTDEKDIVLKLFDKGKIIVADGGQQFVRNIDVCDWSTVRDRNNIKLKYCLRQKENLIKFINEYTKKQGIIGGKVLSKNDMPGGKVIVAKSSHALEIVKNESKLLTKAGNVPYDLLMLAPHTLVKKSSGVAGFSLKDEYEKEGIYIWDGTNDRNRDEYSVDMEEIRVLQYESSRGLEGWTVVCLDFDTFIKSKESSYVEECVEALLLETPAERKRKFLHNWALIPLTRAIDTLVITINDVNSSTGKVLKAISDEYPDIVNWIE